jgi:hypothetical protein
MHCRTLAGLLLVVVALSCAELRAQNVTPGSIGAEPVKVRPDDNTPQDRVVSGALEKKSLEVQTPKATPREEDVPRQDERPVRKIPVQIQGEADEQLGEVKKNKKPILIGPGVLDENNQAVDRWFYIGPRRKTTTSGAAK